MWDFFNSLCVRYVSSSEVENFYLLEFFKLKFNFNLNLELFPAIIPNLLHLPKPRDCTKGFSLLYGLGQSFSKEQSFILTLIILILPEYSNLLLHNYLFLLFSFHQEYQLNYHNYNFCSV